MRFDRLHCESDYPLHVRHQFCFHKICRTPVLIEVCLKLCKRKLISILKLAVVFKLGLYSIVCQVDLWP